MPCMYKIIDVEKKITYREFYPIVIEPSFGIDRLMYTILENNFWNRKEDPNKLVLSLPRELSPYDVSVFQLFNRPELLNMANSIIHKLTQSGFKCYSDYSSIAIGKRYIRADEIGIKYAVSIDPGSLKDGMVELRERNSINQKRVSISQLESLIAK